MKVWWLCWFEHCRSRFWKITKSFLVQRIISNIKICRLEMLLKWTLTPVSLETIFRKKKPEKSLCHFFGYKAKGQISKHLLQEIKAHKIVKKRGPSGTHIYVCVSQGKKCCQKICLVLYFLKPSFWHFLLLVI